MRLLAGICTDDDVMLFTVVADDSDVPREKLQYALVITMMDEYGLVWVEIPKLSATPPTSEEIADAETKLYARVQSKLPEDVEPGDCDWDAEKMYVHVQAMRLA
jgi:hypothetical protein